MRSPEIYKLFTSNHIPIGEIVIEHGIVTQVNASEMTKLHLKGHHPNASWTAIKVGMDSQTAYRKLANHATSQSGHYITSNVDEAQGEAKSESFVKKATRLIRMNNRNNPPELETLNWNEGQEIAHHIGSKKS